MKKSKEKRHPEAAAVQQTEFTTDRIRLIAERLQSAFLQIGKINVNKKSFPRVLRYHLQHTSVRYVEIVNRAVGSMDQTKRVLMRTMLDYGNNKRFVVSLEVDDAEQVVIAWTQLPKGMDTDGLGLHSSIHFSGRGLYEPEHVMVNEPFWERGPGMFFTDPMNQGLITQPQNKK